MPKVLSAAMLALAVCVAAPAAHAATFLTFGPPAPNSALAGTFGNNSVTDAVFSDVYNFMLPVAGATSASFSTIGTDPMTNINFTSATLNGVSITLSPNGVFEFGQLIGLATARGAQQLVINGTSGGVGSYGGTLSFVPALVPEPAAWALMIMGFGGVGSLARRRRADLKTV